MDKVQGMTISIRHALSSIHIKLENPHKTLKYSILRKLRSASQNIINKMLKIVHENSTSSKSLCKVSPRDLKAPNH